ncbi:MAG: DUF5009 domain-containing protein [Balneola sp.]|nr:DUF5009 domain-containing protein [Balneola sp.]|tara:strand:+ start:3348 stop:4523 length:1176 start_codon:yes stop_codon:yes gene_type:complete
MLANMDNSQQIIKGKRLNSLDFFRGATVASMIWVNNPGSWSYIYGPFAHAEWHGWTPTDLIFPFFLFIVGVSIVLALSKATAKGMSRQELIQKTAIRGVKIFGLGLVLAAFPYVVFSPEFSLHPKIESLRIPGVLQRISVIYIMAAFLFLYTSNKVRWIVSGVILIGYWLAMSLIPVPGFGAGAIDAPEGNIAAYIDQLLLSGHMWKELWDPEGILSTFPALVSTLIGIYIGQLLLKDHINQEQKVLEVLKWGFFWLTLGYLWSWIFPLNKNIWTSSFSLFTGGLASMIFGFCYWFIDVKGHKKGVKWGIAFGINAITIFFLSGLIARIMSMIQITVEGNLMSLKGFLYSVILKGIFTDPMLASVSHSILWVILFFGLASWMQQKDILIKV